MSVFAPQWLFSVIGPLFLVLGVVRTIVARRVVPQALTWLILGAIFSVVAVWLWITRTPPPIS